LTSRAPRRRELLYILAIKPNPIGISTTFAA
jgi:hypothetical protein